MVLKASNLFILNWVNPTTVPIINDNKELTKKIVVQVKLKENNILLV